MIARSVWNSGVLRALSKHIRLSVGVFTILTGVLVAPSTPLQAQSNATGAISGSVSNGSAVNVKNLGTGFERSTTASGDGSYRIGALPPGTYQVTYTDSTGKAVTEEVEVTIGSSASVSSGDLVKLDKYTVTGFSINPVDFSTTESVTVFTEKQFDVLPIARNPNAVALLAPGTTQGDPIFGSSLVSFGGASIAENAYFVNGFNISNFRNGMDPANVPFEFYNQFEVKTGAYSAEFGRSTGGVINANTKSGSNEYHAGANFYLTPNDGRWRAPSSYFVNGDGERVPLSYNGRDIYDEWQGNVYASGPLWKNKVFFYGLYNWRSIEREDIVVNGTQHLSQEQNDPFWGVKVDIIPFQGHRLEYTGFRDESRLTETQVDYDFMTRSKVTGAAPAIAYSDRGGSTHIGRYTGTFFEDLTVSAQWGKSRQNKTDSGTEDDKPFIYDGRSGSLVYISGNPNLLISENSYDVRDAMRFDVEYDFDVLGTHRLRAGLDQEDNYSEDHSVYSGGMYYRYYRIPASGIVNGVAVPAGTTAAVRSRVYKNGGSYTTKSGAWYVEDAWTLLNDRLNLRLGLRNESFENQNAAGDAFIKIDNQYAPRLGASYDLFGDKKTKLSINYGRYHIPVAANTNIRLAGSELFTEEYHVLTSVAADGTNPVLGAKLGDTNIMSDGTIKDRRTLVDSDISPMYQDEWMIAVQHSLTKELSVGVRGTQRSINGTAMDDMIVDHALTAWAQKNGFPNFSAEGYSAYVLGNPGRDLHIYYDFNENGTLESNEQATLKAEDLGYPSAVRKYYSVELFAEKIWNGKWNAQVSYSWSQSYGNYEGWVLSDNGQEDAGLTQIFDTPLYTTNTYGRLPNDRRHQFKAFGSYAITSEFTIGSNILLQSGRPLSKMGSAATLLGDVEGVDTVHDMGNTYQLVPRGSAGETDWLFQTNLSFVYRPKWGKEHLTVGLDIFNLFNGKAVTKRVETAETAAGGVEYTYDVANAWQAPRYVRLSVGLDF